MKNTAVTVTSSSSVSSNSSSNLQKGDAQKASSQVDGSDFLVNVDVGKKLAAQNVTSFGISSGDVNGDSLIDLMDVTALSRSIAGWSGLTVDVSQLDINGDASTDLIDVTYLSRNLAGWTGYDLAPPKRKDVHVLMWRRYTPSEQALVSAYTKRTGAAVTTTVTTENEYATKLIALISANNSPDAVCISSNNFPGFVTRSLQPLDATIFHLDDPIWNKTAMNCTKVNGKYFGVAIAGSWPCESTNYCTYYNPNVLIDCGITTMPYTLYQQGKWNWDAQRQIAQAVYAKNATYTGISLQNYDLYMHSAGTDFVSYDGSQFTNILNYVQSGSTLVKSWAEVSKLNQDKLMSGFNLTSMVNGKVGLFTAISYGLGNESAWFDVVKTPNGAAGLEAVPVAGPVGSTAYIPTTVKTWGVAKGSDNVAGAYSFLRYFLDPINVNMDSTFYNANFQEVYNRITASTAKKSPMYSAGLINYVAADSYNTMITELANTSAANMTTVLSSKKATVDIGVNKVNADFGFIN